MADENTEEWEDETMIVMDLNGIIDSNWVDICGSKCKIVGIDTANPILQLDRYTFSGEYKDAIGTDLLFEKVKKEGTNASKDKDGDGTSSCELKLRYTCCKHLHMNRAFLKEKKQPQKEKGAKGEQDKNKEDEDLTIMDLFPETETETEPMEIEPVPSTSGHDTQTEISEIMEDSPSTSELESSPQVKKKSGGGKGTAKKGKK